MTFQLDPTLLQSTGFVFLNKGNNGGGRMGYHFQIHRDASVDDVAYKRPVGCRPRRLRRAISCGGRNLSPMEARPRRSSMVLNRMGTCKRSKRTLALLSAVDGSPSKTAKFDPTVAALEASANGS